MRRVSRSSIALVSSLSLVTSALLVATCTSPASAGLDPTGGADRPNIVFVLTDDMSANLYKYMTKVVELSHEGITFPNFFDASSWCCPSRASLQAGKYPHNTHVVSNGWPNGGFGRFALNDMDQSIGVQMQSAGYRTGFLGKYLNGYRTDGQTAADKPQFGPAFVPPGWNRWWSGEGGYQGFKYAVVDANDSDRVEEDGAADRDPDIAAHQSADGERHLATQIEANDGGDGVIQTWKGNDAENYFTDVLSHEVTNFIADSDPSIPFFLMVTPYAPHVGIGLDPEGKKIKYPPAPRDRAKSRDRPRKWGRPEFPTGDCGPVACGDVPWPDTSTPQNFNTVQNNRLSWMATEPLSDGKLEAAYRYHVQRIQMLQSVNDMIQAIEDQLAASGLENTWIMFTSDHGYHLGEHALFGGKTTAYDHDVRVPLIVRPPYGLDHGITSDAIVQNVDILPTVMDIAGGTTTPDIDGVSFLPLINGEPVPWRANALFELTNDEETVGGDSYFNADTTTFEGSGLPPTYKAFRTPEYLYIDYSYLDSIPPGDLQAELYNLVDDPDQTNNIWRTTEPLLRQALNNELLAQSICVGPECWIEQLEVPSLEGGDITEPPTELPTTELTSPPASETPSESETTTPSSTESTSRPPEETSTVPPSGPP